MKKLKGQEENEDIGNNIVDIVVLGDFSPMIIKI